jgi:methylated-DNA-[protein]-cysteine S-methyltransferase
MSPIHAGGAPLTATAVAAPWGPVHLAVSEDGVVAIELTTTSEAFVAGLEARRHRAVRLVSAGEARTALLERAIRALEDALAGRVDERAALDALPLDLADRPALDREVLAAVRAIPAARSGATARSPGIGRPWAARAVGGAVGRNPVAMLVPCHGWPATAPSVATAAAGGATTSGTSSSRPRFWPARAWSCPEAARGAGADDRLAGIAAPGAGHPPAAAPRAAIEGAARPWPNRLSPRGRCSRSSGSATSRSCGRPS